MITVDFTSANTHGDTHRLTNGTETDTRLLEPISSIIR